jgi:hypothetical protein
VERQGLAEHPDRTFALGLAAIVAVGFTLARDPARSTRVQRQGLVRLLLIAVAVQAAHFIEEYLTGFEQRFPERLGLDPWPPAFFVTFNLAWLAIWLLAAVGVRANLRIAYFPLWFLAIAAVLNGVAHPALALSAGAYFPGLLTAPILAVIGLLLGVRAWTITLPQAADDAPRDA